MTRRAQVGVSVGALAAVGYAGLAVWDPTLVPHSTLWMLLLATALTYVTLRNRRLYLEQRADDARHREEVVRLHAESVGALETARRSEERYALAAAGANDGLWDWDVSKNVLYCSDRWKLMLGLSVDEEVTSVERWLEQVVGDDRPGLLRALHGHIDADRSHFEHEYRVQHPDDGTRWVLCRGIAVRGPGGRAIRMAGSQTDITEQRRVRDSLAQAAQHDPLTNLPNRTLFRELVQRAIAQGARSERPSYAVLFIDLDDFKPVNDTHGHVFGDRFLVAIAQRLQSQLRPGDSLARLGGDEFAVLVEDFDVPDAVVTITERLERALAEPFLVHKHVLSASASIGIVIGGSNYKSVDAVLRDADIAMYRVKAAGGNGHELFDPAMHASALRRLRLEAELRRAVERRELTVFYQPIVDLQTSTIAGVEALVRWVRPDGRVIQPAEFIPTAEDTGLIAPITYQVLHEACNQTAAWQQMLSRPVDLSVNVSPRMFANPDFVDEVEDAVAESGLLPGSLRLEISESVLLDHGDALDRHFSRLRDAQVAVHLDNFGSGLASLSCLHRYPVEALKLDRSFVARMGTGTRDSVGGAIVKLARELGIGVIAEGVETAQHVRELRALDCPHAQGYLFSHPVQAGEMTPLLARDGAAVLSAVS